MLIAAFVVIAGLFAFPGVSQAEEPQPVPSSQLDLTADQIVGIATGCEEMDHSIVRLYFAYFLRFPDAGGFEFWQARYAGGEWSLTRISEFFARSPEFIARYSSLTDEEFVILLYANVFGRDPDAGGLAHWTGELARGIRRGTIMMAFSESLEFIQQTETVVPMAGYGRWYPTPVKWFCRSSDQQVGMGEWAFVDLLLWNNSGFAQNYTITAYDSQTIGRGNVLFSRSGVIQDFEVLYEFRVPSSGWRRVHFQTANSVVGTIVLFNDPPVEPRPGW